MHIVFDLDGTLVDSSEGIIASYRHIIQEYDLTNYVDEELKGFIGGDLLDNICNKFNLNNIESRVAHKEYLYYYGKKGVYQFSPYKYVVEGIKELFDSGHLISVVTLKNEAYAKKILKILDIDKYIPNILGMDLNSSYNKEDLIKKCIVESKYAAEESIYIGDVINDYKAASYSKLDFIGVTYGFGFKIGGSEDFILFHSFKKLIRFLKSK